MWAYDKKRTTRCAFFAVRDVLTKLKKPTKARSTTRMQVGTISHLQTLGENPRAFT